MSGRVVTSIPADPGAVDLLQLRRALVDRVTELPTVPLLFDTLRGWLDARRRVGVIHLRITDLDLVERLYGWQVFDRIVARAATELRRAATRLPAGSRLALDHVAGAGFVVFIPAAADGSDVDARMLGDASSSLARLLDRAFDDDELDGLNPGLGFRAGHAMLSENPFFRFERQVIAAVREAGGNGQRAERAQETAWRQQLNEILRDATIETVFQPIVRLDSRAVLGWEALSRGPRESVFEMPRPLFELSSRFGAAGRIDRLCCEHAMRDFGRCRCHGKLFVNLLPESLDVDAGRWREQRLPELLADAAVAPVDLVVELSERHAAVAEQRTIELADALRSAGCGLALDDVGTGGLPAATIERIRPDYLKLDASLVRDVDRNMIKQQVLHSVVELADAIDAVVIAEGVERPGEASTLAAAGTDYGQGFLFGSPAPLDQTRHARSAEGGL